MSIRDRIIDFRRVAASSLRPSPHNWRTHPQGQRDALRGILAEIGFAGAELARQLPDGGLELIDGHARAEEMGGQDVPVLITDLSEDEAKKLIAVHDPLAAMAGVDTGRLDALLREVQTGDAALAGLMTQLAEQNGIVPAAMADPDEAPVELEGDPVTQPGQVWQLGKHRLLCGDSTDPAQVEAALGGLKPTLQIVDPPFDLDYDAWPVQPTAKVLFVWARGDKALIWMAGLGLGTAWGVHTLCFTGAARGWARPEQPCLIHEVVYVLRRKGHPALLDKDVVARAGMPATSDGRHFSFRESVLYRDNTMSWAKPVKCMEYAIVYSEPWAVVYDPCAGAGAALLAAHRHGRTFCGVEKNPAWCDYAVKRWEKESGDNAIAAKP